MIEQTISIERIEDVIDIFGSFDENIKLIEHELDVSVVSRDDQLKIPGRRRTSFTPSRRSRACWAWPGGKRPSPSRTSATSSIW